MTCLLDEITWPPNDADTKDYFEKNIPDITLLVENEKLDCHKEILMKHSQYFQVS